MVLSHAATDLVAASGRSCTLGGHDRRPDSSRRTQVLCLDISRADFNAKADPNDPVYAELPPEYGAPPGMCGMLQRHMNGTRRAAEGWQDEYRSTMTSMGFTQGVA